MAHLPDSLLTSIHSRSSIFLSVEPTFSICSISFFPPVLQDRHYHHHRPPPIYNHNIFYSRDGKNISASWPSPSLQFFLSACSSIHLVYPLDPPLPSFFPTSIIPPSLLRSCPSTLMLVCPHTTPLSSLPFFSFCYVVTRSVYSLLHEPRLYTNKT